MDAFGSVLTKQYGSDLTTFDINLIRFGFAAITLCLTSASLTAAARYNCHLLQNSDPTHNISTFKDQQQDPDHQESSRNEGSDDRSHGSNESQTPVWYKLPNMSRKNYLHISIGVVFVTFLCPALSIYALLRIELGPVIALITLIFLIFIFILMITLMTPTRGAFHYQTLSFN